MEDKVKHYEKEFIGNEINKKKDLVDKYKDIDARGNKAPICQDYYKDLTTYLNCVIPKEKRIKFKAPSSGGENSSGEDTFKISLSKDGIPKVLLTSDTFGFSIIDKEKPSRKPGCYAFGALYSSSDDVSFFRQYILDTRTLGGAFLWPVNMCWKQNKTWIGERHNDYNIKRGVGGYIEDRVDLTLLEIKHYYLAYALKRSVRDNAEEYLKKYPSDCIICCLNKQMEFWLTLFDSFEDYIKSLMFYPFVVIDNDDYWPIDIIHSEVKEGDGFNLTGERIETLSDCKDKTGWGIKELYENEDGEGLKRMLNNVRLLTLARSLMMEMVINKEENPWDENSIPQWKKDGNGKWKFEMNPPSES